MPLLAKIFSGVQYNDLKSGQCTIVKNTEESPYIRRCKGKRLTGLDVCSQHAKSVTYKNATGVGRTQYFNTIENAEWFRVYRAKETWITTNYALPGS